MRLLLPYYPLIIFSVQLQSPLREPSAFGLPAALGNEADRQVIPLLQLSVQDNSLAAELRT